MKEIKTMVRQHAPDLASLLGLVVVIIIFSFTTQGQLYSSYNFYIIVQQAITLTITAVGAVFIYALGGMDISIGSALGVSCMLEVLILNATGNITLAILASLAVTIVYGLVNSLVSSWLRIPMIITSLFLMFLGQGIQLMISERTSASILVKDYDFTLWKDTGFQLAVMIMVILIVGFLFNFTVLGKYARAIGANEVCARQSGIRTVRYRAIAFMILAVCISIGSIFLISRTASAGRTTGAGFHMDVMIALILGGMRLSGGMRSRLLSAPVGSITYILLSNGLTLSGVPVNYVAFAKALLFIIVIILSSRQKGVLVPR